MINSQRGRGVAEAEEQGWEDAEKREGNPETREVAACCDVTPKCREVAEAWEPAPILREDAEVCDVTTFYNQMNLCVKTPRTIEVTAVRKHICYVIF